jgi:acetyl esterase/lipase
MHSFVPTLYLATITLAGAAIGLAYRPFRRHPTLAAASFFVGWLTSELALHHAVWIAVVSIMYIVFGALDDSYGWIALALAFVEILALVRIHRRGELTRTIATRALHEGLGRPDLGGGRVFLRSVASPFSVRHREVVADRDIVYAEHDGIRLRADVFHRKDRPEGAPVLVFVHGGAWVLGYKEYQGLPMMHRLAAAGWVCVSVDYRLSPRATFPDHLIDVKRAIAWAKANTPRYGGGGSFLALCGNSAGAHLASLAALTWDRPDFQPGFEDADTRVDACVSFYGVYDFVNRHGQWPHRGLQGAIEKLVLKKRLRDGREPFDDASPIHHVRPDAPAFFVIHGDRDSLVPVDEGRRFAEALRSLSRRPVVYLEVPGAQHAFDMFRSVRSHYTLRAIARFLDTVRLDGEATHDSTGA